MQVPTWGLRRFGERDGDLEPNTPYEIEQRVQAEFVDLAAQ